MTSFYHAKFRSISFRALFSLKRKRVQFLNENSLSIEEKRACFVNESFFTNAKVRWVTLEDVFSLKRKKLVFLNDTFFDNAKVFLRRIRGASRIAYLFILQKMWFSAIFKNRFFALSCKIHASSMPHVSFLLQRFHSHSRPICPRGDNWFGSNLREN